MILLALFGIDDIILLIIIQVVLAAAAYLLAPKPKPDANPFADDSSPPTMAERGSYTPWLRGRRKIGPTILWVGNRRRVKYRSNRTDQYKYVEDAWHSLAVGPGWMIREIRANGKLISRGAINRDTHPSGSLVNLGAGTGKYTIHWGLPTDSANSFLGTNLGILSKWPHLCYITWRNFELGASPVWPRIDYVLECRCENSPLTGTPAFMPGTKTLTGTARAIVATGISGGLRYFELSGDRRKEFPPVGSFVRISGNTGVVAQDFTIAAKTYYQTTAIGPPVVVTKRTRIFIKEAATGATATGTLQPYAEITDDGPNGAHVIAELLFAPWPLGLGKPQSEHNLADLEAIGVALAAEGLPTHVLAKDGATAEETLKAIMEDLGVVCAFDPRMGLMRWLLIREATVVPAIPEDAVFEPLPEIRTMHSEPTVTKAVFKYVDRAHRFRTATTPVTDDPAESLEARSRQASVPMETVIDYQSSVLVSERRSLESSATAQNATYTIHAGRDARVLFPGLRIDVAGIEPRLMIVSTKPDPDGPATVLECVKDFYSAAATTFVGLPSAGLPDTDSEDPDADIAPTVEEPPAGWDSPPPGGSLGAGGPPPCNSPAHPQVYLLRFRASEDVGSTAVYIAETDSDDAFREVARVDGYQTGGYLSEALAASDGPFLSEVGVVLDGVDAAAFAQDLSADEAAWRRGDFLAVVGGEILFVQRMEVVSDTEAILHNCIRARWGTAAADHAAGDPIYVGPPDSIEPFTDESFIPGATLYMRTVPLSGSGQTPSIEDVPSVEFTVTGASATPRAPINLGTADRTNRFVSGDPAAIRWGFFRATTFRTGAGEQPAGTPVEPAEAAGHFILEIRTSDGLTVKRAQVVRVSEFTYTEADRLADFGSEPAAFSVYVKHAAFGAVSEAASAVITKL